MPLYIADYLADTMRLTTEQHGAYLLLIMDYWRNGPLPDEDETLASITKLQLSIWRKYRPVFTKFFSVSGGEWKHKRIDEELLQAKENAEKNEQRARNAAYKRWGKQDEFISSSIANSNAQAILDECPSHTPSPTPASKDLKPEFKHTDLNTPVTEYETKNGVCVTSNLPPSPAGLCCKAIRAQGIPQSNPHHPKLLALIAAGATEQEFAEAAKTAMSNGNTKFDYVLGIVARQREQAAKLILHKGRMPNKQEAIEERNRAVAAQWVPPELREKNHAT